jgi:hypothetical protein
MYGNCVFFSFLGCLLLACQHACLWGCGFPLVLIICVGMIDTKAEFYNKIQINVTTMNKPKRKELYLQATNPPIQKGVLL